MNPKSLPRKSAPKHTIPVFPNAKRADCDSNLPDSIKTYPRHFVPNNINLRDWKQVEKLFSMLIERSIESVERLEQWLLDIGELQACLAEEQSYLYLAMMRQIDSRGKEQEYLKFVKNIESKSKSCWHELNKRYMNASCRNKLPKERYAVYDRSQIAMVKCYSKTNTSLQTEEIDLVQQYNKIVSRMTVEYNGREQTLDQMYGYQLELDRTVREETWKLVAEHRQQASQEIDTIFDRMIKIRNQIAHNAGFETFCDYQFAQYNRFDYTPKDCLRLHETIESLVVPLVKMLRIRDNLTRRKSLGIKTLRPWDMTVNSQNLPPSHPFKNTSELFQKCAKVFTRIDPVLGSQFLELGKNGWLDIDSRKGKASRGFTQPFAESRCPFIFLNCSGVHDEIEMLLHEGGHALHDLACRNEPLFYYRNDYPLEMAEVAGMGFHLLALDHIDVFYGENERKRVIRDSFEKIIHSLAAICAVDAFQYWLYATPNHNHTERGQCWYGLQERFGRISSENCEGDILAQKAHNSSWQQIGHLFRSPFYFIEYAIAQIGALQLWNKARMDTQQTVQQFQQALSLGGSKTLPELWAAAGLEFGFGKDILLPLIENITKELRQES